MRKISLFLITSMLLSAAYSQVNMANTVQAFNLASGNLAIEGYDPVSYFSKNKAIKGQSGITTIDNGVVYRFESQENKKAFVAHPAKYQPQYGGWCAYAMGSSGEKVDIDPETFKIVNGKLYLFYNKFFNNTLKSWNKDEAQLMKKADANWMKVINSSNSK